MICWIKKLRICMKCTRKNRKYLFAMNLSNHSC